ncbi:Septin-domain-containing protein [Powellomyces hirtus]|nr:Septin-domain-containing protein [Powellomyces hirtus]
MPTSASSSPVLATTMPETEIDSPFETLTTASSGSDMDGSLQIIHSVGVELSESAVSRLTEHLNHHHIKPPHLATGRQRSAEFPIIPSLDDQIQFDKDSALTDELSVAATGGELKMRPDVAKAAESATNLAAHQAWVDQMKEKFLEEKAACVRRGQSALRAQYLTVGCVGDSGIGKTSLLRRLLKSPQIVKYDKLPLEQSTARIQTFNATTVHPQDLPDDEKPWNMLFVDTPGFGAHTDALLTIRPVLSYQTTRFRRAHADFSIKLPFPELQHYHSVNRHGQLDVILYGLLHRIKPVDVEYIRQLSGVANVVPLLLKSDTMTAEQVRDLKIEVLETVAAENLAITTFGMEIEGLIALVRAGVEDVPPFAVCGTELGDGTNMKNASASQTAAATTTDVIGPQDVATNVKDEAFHKHADEFAHLQRRILELYASDFRRLTAQKFAKWRESVIATESASANTTQSSSRRRSTTRNDATDKRDCDLGGPFSASEVIWIVAAFGLLAASVAVTAGSALCGVKIPGALAAPVATRGSGAAEYGAWRVFEVVMPDRR